MRDDLLNDTELKNLNDVCDVLSKFDKASEDLSGEQYVTSSLLLPILSYLQKALEAKNEDSSFKASLKKELLESIQFYDKKFNMSNNELLRACTYLNPTFKNMKSFQREERDNVISSTKKFLFNTYESYINETNSNLKKSDTISNMQKPSKKSKLNLNEYDSDSDDDNCIVELSELEKEVILNI